MNNQEQFDKHGNRPNDFSDGVTITALLLIVVASAIYYLYTM